MKEKWFEFYEQYLDEGFSEEQASDMAEQAVIDLLSNLRDTYKEQQRG